VVCVRAKRNGLAWCASPRKRGGAERCGDTGKIGDPKHFYDELKKHAPPAKVPYFTPGRMRHTC